MNAMRLAVGVLLVVLTSKTCMRARAQYVERPAKGRFCAADPSDRLFQSAQEETAIRVPFDDHLLQAWDESVSVSNLTSPAPGEQQFAVQSCDVSEDDVRDECCCPPCDRACPSLYGQVEAVFLWRESRLIDQPIVDDPNTGTTFLSASDLDFGLDPGLRATVGVRLCGSRALEFSYFGLFQGDASAVVISPDPDAFLSFPDNLFGNVFVDMDRVQVNYSSWLNSLEANLPCCCGCCDQCCNECGCREVRCRSYEWFAGFRYVNVGEELNILAQRIVAGGVEEGSYNIRTANHLYGAQLGGRLRRTRGQFGWEATGKAGIFGNDAHQTQSVTDFPDFPLRPTVSSRSGGVAFVGETNLSFLYRLTHIWNLRAGYSALWIEGLALAPDQLDFNFASSPSGNQLRNGGGMILHGVNVGLEARW